MEYLLMRVCIEDTGACASDTRRSKTRSHAFKGVCVGINFGGQRTKVDPIVVEVVVREGKEHAVS